MNQIYPSWPQIEELTTKLTDGERDLAKFLDKHLPDTWSIYVQPYINDMRPDVVVCNPNIGIVVFEVKDWTLGRYSFQGGQMIAQTATSRWVEDDPVKKVQWYARSLYAQFLVCDEAKLSSDVSPNDLVICRAAIYFYRASTAQSLNLYHGPPNMTTTVLQAVGIRWDRRLLVQWTADSGLPMVTRQ